MLFAASIACQAAPSKSLDFDATFDTRGEPSQAYFAATYRMAGTDHRVEVWRDGERRLKRRTDDAIETHVEKAGDDVEWHMTVLDLTRRIRTDVDRTNLYRIGHFVEWFELSHALTRPKGPYTLTALAGEAPHVDTVAACRWYRLQQASRTTRICWSQAMRVPLAITDDAGQVAWRVTRMHAARVPREVFAIADQGFARNDANRDIQAD